MVYNVETTTTTHHNNNNNYVWVYVQTNLIEHTLSIWIRHKIWIRPMDKTDRNK